MTPSAFQRTRLAVLSTGALSEPLLILYNLSAFILRKDFEASLFQIALLTMLRPLASLLSLYWSASVFFRPENAVKNVVWAGILSRALFFLFPLITNSWLFISAIVIYMMLYRGAMPAWLEIIKTYLPSGKREKHFSWGSIFAYTEGVLLGIGIGHLLDHSFEAWRWLFPFSALIGLAGVFLQGRIPPLALPASQPPEKKEGFAFLWQPWKEAWQLLLEKRDFARFQWAMMLFGVGIMIIQPALPFFFIDTLHLSYTDLALAFAICRGAGFALTSNLWARWLSRKTIYGMTGAIFVLMAAFPLFLLFSKWHITWIYAAYATYGVAQAGVHLSWNLSGPLFAKEQNSTLYSTVNVLTIGVRGCFVPLMGSGLCSLFGPVIVLICGVFFSLWAAIKMTRYALLEKASLLAHTQE